MMVMSGQLADQYKKENNMKNIWVAVTAVLFFFTGLFPALAAAEFQLMTKEELKPQLGSPDLIVIDARSQAQWESSHEAQLV